MTGNGATSESASVGLRYFGAQLALLRTRAGMTQAELGARIGYSESTVSSVEQGRRVPQSDFIERVDAELAADGMLRAGVPFLAQARYPAHFQDFAQLETTAVSLYSYESQLVPGLLQTEAYARAWISSHCPPLDDATIDQRVAARLDRQALLSRTPAPILGFVIEEASLRRRVGAPGVVKEQLGRLVEHAGLRHVTVQVMPMTSVAHSGMNGPMLLLETADGRSVAYVEAQEVSAVISDRKQVSVFAQRYGIIRAQALDTTESVRLIERLAGEL